MPARLPTLITEFLHRHRARRVSVWFQMRRHVQPVRDEIEIVVAVDQQAISSVVLPDEVDAAGCDLLAIELDRLIGRMDAALEEAA